eukprot:901329-Rhodomonas_salina.2
MRCGESVLRGGVRGAAGGDLGAGGGVERAAGGAAGVVAAAQAPRAQDRGLLHQLLLLPREGAPASSHSVSASARAVRCEGDAGEDRRGRRPRSSTTTSSR